jgi:hypothetical protein
MKIQRPRIKGPQLKKPRMKRPRLKGPKLSVPRLKRPRIKGPNVKMPRFATDLFQDLRDRHLLPLVALLAAGIVAVPFLLGSSASTPPGSPVDASQGSASAAGSGAESGPPTARLVVVAANPGLRDYRLRLRALEAKNPFRQHFIAPQLAGSDLNDAASTTVPTSTAPESSTTVPSFGGDSGTPTGGGTSTSGGGGGEVEVKVETEYVQYTVDIKVVRKTQGGGTRQARERIFEDVEELSMLPSEKAPVAVFMGVSADREKALLLVSEKVSSVYGDVRCMVGSESCQLIMVEPGFPVTFVYGDSGRAYRFNVLRIEETVRERP